MISRRNIRVKVMQTLYTLSTQDTDQAENEQVKLLQRHFDQTRDLLIYFLYYVTEVPAYSETDAHIRNSKHLPTKEDLQVNTKIAGNEILWEIRQESSFKEYVDKSKVELRADKELIRKLYIQLKETPAYKKYMAVATRDRKSESEVMNFIFQELLLPNELFLANLEENFSNWDDDGDMIIQLVKGYLNKPGSFNFNEIISGEKWMFARTLLTTVLDKDEHLETFIFPKLKNWDSERIAALDMILMKMGVAEFLYFQTIPPKVTINEYIELAKDYSTQQSGQFINGILDNIHKELIQQGKMYKTDFRRA
ncbi:MAG: transcription antitermination factor NusB [Chitinophagaceae bacterium]